MDGTGSSLWVPASSQALYVSEAVKRNEVRDGRLLRNALVRRPTYTEIKGI